MTQAEFIISAHYVTLLTPIMLRAGKPIEQELNGVTWRLALLETCPVNRLCHSGMETSVETVNLN